MTTVFFFWVATFGAGFAAARRLYRPRPPVVRLEFIKRRVRVR